MSRYYHTDDFFVDTGLLRDHVSILREERKNASRLYANVATMRSRSDPADVYKYNSLLRDIELLISYFDRMANVLSNAEDEAVHMSHEIGCIIEEDTMRTRRAVSQSFML